MKLDKGQFISPFSYGKKDISINAKTFVGTEIVDGKSVITRKIIQYYLSIFLSMFLHSGLLCNLSTSNMHQCVSRLMQLME